MKESACGEDDSKTLGKKEKDKSRKSVLERETCESERGVKHCQSSQ